MLTPPAPLRVVMMGTGTFAEPTFLALLGRPDVCEVVGLMTQPDRAGVTVRGSTRQTGEGMKPIALRYKVPVLQPDSVNTDDGVAQLRGWRPDLLVVAAYGQILNRAVLGVPARGAINVHASLLPKYRGASPVAHAILAGERETGVTIIRLTLGLDAGDMLAGEAVAIDLTETAGDLESRLALVGAGLAVGVVERLRDGEIVGEKQDAARATRAPKLNKTGGLIPWAKSAADVVRHVYAMQPWPTPYTYWRRDGQPPLRVIVCAAAVADLSTAGRLAPGALVVEGSKQGRLFAATGDGFVEVLEVQPAGKKRMSAAEFLRGRPVVPGDRFGAETP